MGARKFHISVTMEIGDSDISRMIDAMDLPSDCPPAQAIHQTLMAFYAELRFEDLAVEEIEP